MSPFNVLPYNRTGTAAGLVASPDHRGPAVPEGFESFCDFTCRNSPWRLIQLWLKKDNGALGCVRSWSDGDELLEHFIALSGVCQFFPGVGLPGKVVLTGSSQWVEDMSADASLPRSPVARRDGIHTAFALPLFENGQVYGVLEFLASEQMTRNDDLVSFIQRRVNQLFGNRAAAQVA